MPSAKVLESKKAIVSSLAEELRAAMMLVVADGRGLTVAEDTELRKALREAGVTYKVVKNSLVSRAAKEAELEGLDEVFTGPTAIAYSKEDVVTPAKLLQQYADKFEKLEIKGGAMEGKPVELAEIKRLASIPSLEVLHGQLVGGLVSPIAALAIYLNEIAKKCEEASAETAEAVWKGPQAQAEEEPAQEASSEEATETSENA